MTEGTGNIVHYFISAIHSLGRAGGIRRLLLVTGWWLIAGLAMIGQVTFDLVKSETYPSPAAPGDLVTYTITYRNTSTSTATTVIITDNLPLASLFTYVSSSNAGVHNSGVPSVVWNIGTVPSNGSGFVTVSGHWGIPGALYIPPYNLASYYTSYGSSINTITNRASILSDQSPLGFSAPDVSAVVPQTCGSTFPGGSNNIKQGEDKIIYYPMTIVNTGNIYDNFILDVPPLVQSRNFSSDLLLRILDINKNLMSQSGWIPPGGSFSFLLELDGTSTARKPTAGDIFDITVTSTSTVCANQSTATVTTTTYNGNPSDQQDISVTKTASVGSYTVGTGPVTYTIIMSNIGQSQATGVVLRDNLPANILPLNPGDINQGGILSGNTITWPALPIDPDVTLPPYTVTITPTCLSVPTLVNTAWATLSQVDKNPLNNTSTNTISVTYSGVTPVLSTTTPFICSNSTANLTASGASGSQIYRWYLTASGGPNIWEGSSYSPLLTSITTFYVSIYDPITQCESNRSSITIVVNPLPTTSAIYHQ